jgi:hypothetical protein
MSSTSVSPRSSLKKMWQKAQEKYVKKEEGGKPY